jgi:hypothetical protein
MSDKGVCHACNRKILNTTHQKCMYCGAELPKEQQFSEQEIDAIGKRRARDKEEEKRVNRRPGNSGIHSDSGWLDISDSGDCGSAGE